MVLFYDYKFSNIGMQGNGSFFLLETSKIVCKSCKSHYFQGSESAPFCHILYKLSMMD